jgi:hypothetical protein
VADILQMRPKPKPAKGEEERAYEAKRARALITKALGDLRDNSSPDEAIKFLEETLAAIRGSEVASPHQRKLTAAAIAGVADSFELRPDAIPGPAVAAILRDVAAKFREGGGP